MHITQPWHAVCMEKPRCSRCWRGFVQRCLPRACSRKHWVRAATTRPSMRDARCSAGGHPRKTGNKAGAALSWLPLILKSPMGLKAWGGLRCCGGLQGARHCCATAPSIPSPSLQRESQALCEHALGRDQACRTCGASSAGGACHCASNCCHLLRAACRWRSLTWP